MPQERSLAVIRSEEKTLRERVAQLVDQRREAEIRLDVDGADDGLEERKANIERGIGKASARLAELGEEHRQAITRMVEFGRTAVEAGVDLDAYPANTRNDEQAGDPHRRAALDGALRTLERCQSRDTMSGRAAVALERLVRHGDPAGTTGRYLTAAGDPAYNSAFGKILRYGDSAAMRMTADEMTAVQRVAQVEFERAMIEGTGSLGGFALPIEIDPSVLLTSSGALNPIRQLADVRQMVGFQLRLVSADTPASTYAAELTEVADGSPTLVQPTVTAQKGQSFIPFSIELGMDWASIQKDLLQLLSDGKDILDATMFLSGSGVAEPVGIFAASGGLTNAQRIQTATAATTTIGDLYALRQGLTGTRFWRNAVFVAAPTAWDVFYRYVAQASTTDPLPFTDGRGGPFLGTRKEEWSTMSAATTTTGSNVAIVGDWSGYVIGDRVGAQVELVSHLFGATSRFPTGERGLYYFWRTGTSVSKPNAFRFLQVK